MLKSMRKLLSYVLAIAMAFGLFAAAAPAAGVSAASGGAVIDLNESWFGKTSQKDPSGIWEYDAPLHLIKIIGDATITGKIAGTERTFTLDIYGKAKVTWAANYSGSSTILISLRGGGAFEVAKGGAIVNGKSGFAIDANGSVSVHVNGGAVRGVQNAVINANGKDPSITVSDGIVENTGGSGSAISAAGNIAVSGGIVKAAGETATISGINGNAITISGGTVLNTGTGTAISSANDGAIVTVSGGLVESQNHGQTISAGRDMTMTGGAVRNAGDSQAIIITKNLNISGGVVSAAENFAIYANGVEAAMNINGGFIFAYGSGAVLARGAAGGAGGNVIDGSSAQVGIGGNAIICAWNKAAKRTEYKEGTGDDLTVSPAGAAAVWGIGGGKSGIKYANGTNTGFIEMGEVTVTPDRQAAAQATATPAPTTGPSAEPTAGPTAAPTTTPTAAPTAAPAPAPSAGPASPSGEIWSKANGWALPELRKAAELGLIPETFEGMDFTRPITRAEFAAVSVKVYESLSGETPARANPNPFTDTRDIYVLKAYNAGFTAGTSPAAFEPDLLLNREQAATMLARVYKRAAFDGWTLAADADFPLPFTRQAPFADDANISGWARDSVYFMASKGIINGIGDNLFAPRNITQAEEANFYANATLEQALLIAARMVLAFAAK